MHRRPVRRPAALLVLLSLVIGGPLATPMSASPNDYDGDGLTNTFERWRSLTHRWRVDSDRDGLRDGVENPDRDGLTNRAEQNLGTHPRKADSDADGWTDGVEYRAGTNPLSASSRPGPPKPKPTPTPPPSPSPTPTSTATPSPSASPTASPTPSGAGAPTLPGAPNCPVFPATNVWNVPIDNRPVATDSDTLITTIGLDRGLHMDFGSYAGYGIPYNVVDSSTPRTTVAFEYEDESDHVGYPIPGTPKIEGGSDRHILMVDRDACRLYELFAASVSSGSWSAGSGATWDMRSNALRPLGWTSADAAGLPILPGLVRYDEVVAGAINHALRFTAPQTRRAYVYPARHFASSSTSLAFPPMGVRVRLKSNYDTSRFSATARVIADALKKYGMILADNGSPWYITGASDPRFDDDILHELDAITGRDLEVVDTTNLINGP